MDRYDPYTDKFLRDTQYNILGTNLAEVGTDCISRQAAIDEAEEWIEAVYCDHEEQRERSAIKKVIQGIKCLPSAQPERIIYANMSDEEFEKWLYEHGICNPNIHEPIPCDVVPLLIDNAISELPSAQPEIVRCKDCKHWIPYDWMFSEIWQSKNIVDYPEDEIGCDCCDMAMKANDFCSRAVRGEVTE